MEAVTARFRAPAARISMERLRSALYPSAPHPRWLLHLRALRSRGLHLPAPNLRGQRILRALVPAVVVLGACSPLSAPQSPAAPPAAPLEVELPPCSPGPVHFGRAPGGALELDPRALAANRCRVRIVDVRQRAELEGELGRIDGSEWAPLEELESRAERWGSDEPIVLVDRSGRRASRAQEHLAGLGFRQVASLTGGLLAWHAHGLPVVRGPLPQPAPVAAAADSQAPPARPGSDPIAAQLADPASIQWVTVASILGTGTQQCIDGRAGGPVVGTPGGDAGEIALALSALEHTARREVPISAVAPTLAAYAQSFGRFYMHTDQSALARVGVALAADPRFAEARAEGRLEPDTIAAFVRSPPAELEAALLEHLVRPEGIGCGHLRLMLQHPSEYGARRELVLAVIRESYRLGWSHPELLSLAVLEGEHDESAVVRVWLDQPIHAYTRVPTFPSAPGEHTAFFVAHPEVSAFLRRELGSFLVENASMLALRAPQLEAFEHELDALAARQVAATLRHLARELPVYDVHVRDGIPQVSGPNGSLGCRDY